MVPYPENNPWLLKIVFNHNPAGQWGLPNRSSVSIEKREMACSFYPDAQAPLRHSSALTCLVTLDTLKGTNPYMIKGNPIIVHLPVDSYTCEIKDSGIPNLVA